LPLLSLPTRRSSDLYVPVRLHQNQCGNDLRNRGNLSLSRQTELMLDDVLCPSPVVWRFFERGNTPGAHRMPKREQLVQDVQSIPGGTVCQCPRPSCALCGLHVDSKFDESHVVPTG